MLKHLKDFTQIMAVANPEEKAQILQLVLKNVRVSKESLTLNLYDFSSLKIVDKGLKNRTEWLRPPQSPATRSYGCPRTTYMSMDCWPVHPMA
jgi:hypothetical protein